MRVSLQSVVGLFAFALLVPAGCAPEGAAPPLAELEASGPGPSASPASVPAPFPSVPKVEAAPPQEADERAGEFSETAFTTYADPRMDELLAERAFQLTLPMADGPMWDALRRTRVTIDEASQLYRADHPPEVRAMAGRPLTIQGYVLPLEVGDRIGHFLVSPYTPVCFFHPPAEPNEIIEVRLRRPIRAGFHLVEVQGTLSLVDDGEKGLFFQLSDADARIVDSVDF